MPTELWISAQTEVDQLVAIVASNPAYTVQEITEDYDDLVERSPATEKDGIVRIRGSIISFIDRLDDELVHQESAKHRSSRYRICRKIKG